MTPEQHPRDVARFLSKFERGDGCWQWRGYPDGRGYGVFHTCHAGDKRAFRAHRWSYEHFVGPIPEGLTIDHLCRNRLCVNPSHMEPVTNAENLRRGESFSAKNARKTHCVHGHEYTPGNTIIERYGRSCRECRRLRDRARKDVRTVYMRQWRQRKATV